jgi:hypothetical protein
VVSCKTNTSPEIGDIVHKSGRTTGYTKGRIIATNLTVQVDLGVGMLVRFVDQIVCDDFSAGGDSGSAVFDDSGNLVGLLFAGSPTVTILNKIDHVFDQLGIDGIVQ